KNTKYQDLREDYSPIAFVPEAQYNTPDDFGLIYVRSNGALSSVTAGLKRAAADVSPRMIVEFEVFQTQIRQSLLREQLMATLAGFFGLLAVLLATIGLYGVMSYTVTRRTSEIGIRMALGADRRDVMRMILHEAAKLLGIGLLV